jgi:hypothetical protein
MDGALEKLADAIYENAFSNDRIAAALDRLADVAEKALRLINPPPAPQPPAAIVPLAERFLTFGETRMDIEQFSLNYPEHPTADVVSREVTLTIATGAGLPPDVPIMQTRSVAGRLAGGTGDDLTLGRDIATVGAFEVPQGYAFSVGVISIDDGGNQTASLVQEFTAEDHTAPAAEGGGTVTPLAERTVPDPVV